LKTFLKNAITLQPLYKWFANQSKTAKTHISYR